MAPSHTHPATGGPVDTATTFASWLATGVSGGPACAVRVKSRKAPDWFTARQAAEPTYGFKVLLEEGSDRVLGAHLVGPHADEVINLFALAIRHGLTADDLQATLFAYPTAGSDIGYML